MQKIMICGNLTNDPVLSDREYTVKETGEIIKTKVCNFSVAVNDSYDRKEATYFKVAAWRGLGETCAKYLSKGRGVLVSGIVRLNNYVDKNGNTRSAMEIRADEIQFLGGNRSQETQDHVMMEDPVGDDGLPY